MLQPPGSRARVRVINTEYGLMPVWVSGAPYRLAAVDGTELNGPAPVRDTAVLVTAGRRAGLEVTMPADGSPVRVHLGGPVGVVLGSGSRVVRVGRPSKVMAKAFSAVSTRTAPARTPRPARCGPGLSALAMASPCGKNSRP